jgi:hypothetical protein
MPDAAAAPVEAGQKDYHRAMRAWTAQLAIELGKKMDLNYPASAWDTDHLTTASDTAYSALSALSATWVDPVNGSPECSRPSSSSICESDPSETQYTPLDSKRTGGSVVFQPIIPTYSLPTSFLPPSDTGDIYQPMAVGTARSGFLLPSSAQIGCSAEVTFASPYPSDYQLSYALPPWIPGAPTQALIDAQANPVDLYPIAPPNFVPLQYPPPQQLSIPAYYGPSASQSTHSSLEHYSSHTHGAIPSGSFTDICGAGRQDPTLRFSALESIHNSSSRYSPLADSPDVSQRRRCTQA